MSHIGTRVTLELYKMFSDFCEKTKRTKSEVITTSILKEVTGINPEISGEWRPLGAKLFDIPISKVRYSLTLPTVYEALLFMSDKSKKIVVDRIPDEQNYVFQFTVNEDIFVVSTPVTLSKMNAIRDILIKLDNEIVGGIEKWAEEQEAPE